MLDKKIIATVGLCGSGKSVVCDYLEKDKGYKKVYFGGLVIEEVKKRNMEIKEENEKMVREELRKKYGMGAMAVLSIDKINNLLKNGNKVLIDGLYSFSEYKILKENYPNMVVIAVFTPKHIRYDRLSKRTIRPLTPTEAENRDIAEIENIEKGGPIALADYTLLNNKDVENLKCEINKILKELKL